MTDLVIGVRSHLLVLLNISLLFIQNSFRQGPFMGLKAYRASVCHCGHFDSFKSIGTELTLYAASRG